MGLVSGCGLQTKSSKRGMPWAFLVRAISGEHWGRNGLTHRSKVFCVPTRVDPCPFLLALAQFWRCLVCHGGLNSDMACWSTLHSLKATMSCWASCVGVAESVHGAQGYHRSQNAQGCAAKYMRRSCQRDIMAALNKGWIPMCI